MYAASTTQNNCNGLDVAYPTSIRMVLSLSTNNIKKSKSRDICSMIKLPAIYLLIVSIQKIVKLSYFKIKKHNKNSKNVINWYLEFNSEKT